MSNDSLRHELQQIIKELNKQYDQYLIKISDTYSAYKAAGGWVPFNHLTDELIPSISDPDADCNLFSTVAECVEFISDLENGRIFAD